jgi:NTE family protein
VESLIRSTLENRVQYETKINVIDIDVGATNIFDFNIEYEDKLKLYNIGFLTI